MNRTIYFLRKSKLSYMEQELINKYQLDLCLKKKNEMILKSNDLLISCRNKYIALLVYERSNEQKVVEISKFLEKG